MIFSPWLPLGNFFQPFLLSMNLFFENCPSPLKKTMVHRVLKELRFPRSIFYKPLPVERKGPPGNFTPGSTQQLYIMMCSSRKYTYPPMEGHWKFQGNGGSQKQTIITKYEAKVKFHRVGVGGSSNQSNLCG